MPKSYRRSYRSAILMGFALVSWAGTSGTAAASPLDDCLQQRDLALRLDACSRVIAGPSGAVEKAKAYRARGEARLEAGAAKEALADFSAALAADASDAAAYAGRGRAHLLEGNEAGAIADLSEAIRLAPRSPFYRNARGHAHLVNNEPRLALEDFAEAARLDPKSASALNNRGLAHAKLGDGKAAIADYTSAIGLNPAYAIAYVNRGQAHEAAGDTTSAIADYSRALGLDTTLLGASEGLTRLKSGGTVTAEAARAIAEGRRIAEKNCAWCHATGPKGASPNPKAPPFRTLVTRHAALGLREPLSRGIAAPHDQMPNFKLADADVDKIVAYINSIGRGTEK